MTYTRPLIGSILLTSILLLGGCESNPDKEAIPVGGDRPVETAIQAPQLSREQKAAADVRQVEQETKAYGEQTAAFKKEIAADTKAIQEEKISRQIDPEEDRGPSR